MNKEEQIEDLVGWTTMFNQLKTTISDINAIYEIIISYFKALHRYFDLPDSTDFVTGVLISRGVDIKFEDDFIVFFKTGTDKIITKVYAPC